MSDCIDRQTIIDLLTSRAETLRGLYGDLGGAASGVRKLVQTLPSAKPEQKWIPVSEALPENTEFVLLTIRRLDKSYNQIPFISVGYISWNQTAWWCAHDGDCDAHNVEVLAWMPLPEPYEEGE